MSQPRPVVGIIMGSKSDLATMQNAADTLASLEIPFEMRVISAHRTPHMLIEYASQAANRGIKLIIAGAGGAAHLAGVTAGLTTLPVLGVPMQSQSLNGLDSLLSIVQMPGGVPVGTFAIGKPGAVNAALFAAAILGLSDPALAARYNAYRESMTTKALADTNITPAAT